MSHGFLFCFWLILLVLEISSIWINLNTIVINFTFEDWFYPCHFIHSTHNCICVLHSSMKYDFIHHETLSICSQFHVHCLVRFVYMMNIISLECTIEFIFVENCVMKTSLIVVVIFYSSMIVTSLWSIPSVNNAHPPISRIELGLRFCFFFLIKCHFFLYNLSLFHPTLRIPYNFLSHHLLPFVLPSPQSSSFLPPT